MSNDDRQALAGKALHALKWNVAGVAGRVLLQLVVMVWMARLVGPTQFGIFGLCMLVFALAILVADLGLGMALVQRDELERPLLRRAWGRVLLSHLIVAASIALTASRIAAVLGVPEAAPHLRLTALTILISSIQPPALALRRRSMDFRCLQQAQVLGYALGFGVLGILLANFGFGAWSLVLALLGQQLIVNVIILRGQHFPYWPTWSCKLDGLQTFGSRVVISNIANWTTDSLPNTFVSRYHGSAGLGLYTVAYNLARTPTGHIVSTLQQLLLSAASRVQADREGLAKAYLAVLKAVCLVSLPMFLAGAAVAETLIAGLYGAKWTGAAALFVPMALAMPFHAVMAIAGPMLWGRGRTGVELRVQVAVALALAATMLALSGASLVTLSWAVCAIYALRAFWVTSALLKDLSLSWRHVIRALWPCFLFALLIASLLRGLDRLLMRENWAGTPSLIAIIVSGVLLFCVFLRVANRYLLGTELAPLVARVPLRWRGLLGV